MRFFLPLLDKLSILFLGIKYLTNSIKMVFITINVSKYFEYHK